MSIQMTFIKQDIKDNSKNVLTIPVPLAKNFSFWKTVIFNRKQSLY